MLENRNISHRFRAFAQHPYCDWFLQVRPDCPHTTQRTCKANHEPARLVTESRCCQAVGNYIEAYLSRSRVEMAIVAKEKIQWGALGCKPHFETLSPTKLAAAAVSDTTKEEAYLDTLFEETEESLKQLSTIYMRVMLDFSDFDKALALARPHPNLDPSPPPGRGRLPVL